MANRPRNPSDRPQSVKKADRSGQHPVKVNLLISSQAKSRDRQSGTAKSKLDQAVTGKTDRRSALTRSDQSKSDPSKKYPAQQRRFADIRTSFLTTVLLLGTAALVIEGSRVAVQLIIDPGSVSWLSWLMPGWNRTPLSHYQTLSEVRSEATALGTTVGEVLPLSMASTAKQTVAEHQEFLVPILAPQRRCGNSDSTHSSADSAIGKCQGMIELRVYRSLSLRQPNSREPYLELIDRATITGPREFFVVAPLATTSVISPGTSDSLPLDQVSVMEGAKSPKLWFDLSGELSQGNNQIAYGQVVGYDPQKRQLYPLTQWTSPVGVHPSWQQVTGNADPELLMNETVGLQPNFKLYQIKPGHRSDPVQLNQIALTASGLESYPYETGLLLARHGLWTPALQWMQTARRDRGGNLPAIAQSQLDLIALHAQVTKAQADRSWANPGQAVIANLSDGRWTKALQFLQAAIGNGYQVDELLTADADRLWDQVETVLSVDAQQPDVQAWGALILFARKGREAALTWLQQHNASVAALSRASLLTSVPTVALDRRLQQVLDVLNNALTVAEHPSRILGTVTPLSTINVADWQRPPSDPSLTLAEQQAWYRIQVASFYDGQQWQRSPFTRLNLSAIGIAQQFWGLLGLSNDPQIQLIVWTADAQPQTIEATIKAVRVQGGRLQLLASGAAPAGISFAADRSPRPLAMTTASIHWIEPSQTLTLSELDQQQPQWTAALLPVLWQTAQPTSLVSTPSSPEIMLQTVGNWSAKLIDLTGDDRPEAIITLLNQVQRRTLIFSDQGALIYNELGSDGGQSFTAIADDGDGRPALLVEADQTYRLLHWSTQHRRFE
jgi:hypothetical protein